MNTIFWEKSYKDMGSDTFGKPSKEVVELSKKLKTNAKILDVGCGEGRHTAFLAALGFEVHAIDISKDGIEKLKKSIGDQARVTAEVCDIKVDLNIIMRSIRRYFGM